MSRWRGVFFFFLSFFQGADAYAESLCKGYMQSSIMSFPSQFIFDSANKTTFWKSTGLTGSSNLEVIKTDSVPFLRVHFPQGSFDPGSMRRLGKPVGGANFFLPFSSGGFECVVLKYKVRFPGDFDFVKGGKILGVYGGEGNSGGRVPNGYDGFSFRVIWKELGEVALYSYVPGISKWGRAGKINNFTFQRGRWVPISLMVRLNTGSASDGYQLLEVGPNASYSDSKVFMRASDSLKIDGLFFSTFFGGNNEEFASSLSTYIDFSEIEVEGYR